jgi:hypothetical protein
MNTRIDVNQPLIQPSSSTRCKASSLKSQFACPTGLLGRFVGRLMAIKNARMNEFAVEMLDVQADDQALEIGFGHGRIIWRAAGHMPAHAFDKPPCARARLYRRRGRGRRGIGAVGGIPRHKNCKAECRARGFLRDCQAVRSFNEGGAR